MSDATRTERGRDQLYTIRHLTRYRYSAEVVDNLNALRVRPANTPDQRLEDFSVRIRPEARQQRWEDYFGTEVIEFEVTRPHHELVIDARARVVRRTPAAPPEPDWATLRQTAYREAAGEFLLQTDDASEHPVLASLIADAAGAAGPLALARRVAELIPDRLEYRRGATWVDTPVRAVLDGGAGVCQDFVHVGLCVLRHHGVAARYVSGYLFAAPVTAASEAGPGVGGVAGAVGGTGMAESVEVDTHAWIEVLLPDGDNPDDAVWVGIDPTNRRDTGVEHVKIGHGRHYADVPPIKGVYRGMAESELDAQVTMTRVERAEGPARS